MSRSESKNQQTGGAIEFHVGSEEGVPETDTSHVQIAIQETGRRFKLTIPAGVVLSLGNLTLHLKWLIQEVAKFPWMTGEQKKELVIAALQRAADEIPEDDRLPVKVAIQYMIPHGVDLLISVDKDGLGLQEQPKKIGARVFRWLKSHCVCGKCCPCC